MRLSTTFYEQISHFDWDALEHTLDERGYATLPSLFTISLLLIFRSICDTKPHDVGQGRAVLVTKKPCKKRRI